MEKNGESIYTAPVRRDRKFLFILLGGLSSQVNQEKENDTEQEAEPSQGV